MVSCRAYFVMKTSSGGKDFVITKLTVVSPPKTPNPSISIQNERMLNATSKVRTTVVERGDFCELEHEIDVIKTKAELSVVVESDTTVSVVQRKIIRGRRAGKTPHSSL